MLRALPACQGQAPCQWSERSGVSWQPSRAAGLERLAEFLPNAGDRYRRLRNYDFGSTVPTNVSGMAPYLRCRLVREDEVLAAVLERFAPATAEKFIQEVYWRSYWKGWLEHHPSVWPAYLDRLQVLLAGGAGDDALALRYDVATAGETGIAVYDDWARELTGTGYLHNHARMWFASIWIFTLNLPWQLGADFFLRHLLDGDPASNTLSWRWVAGLHTRGKHYLARPDNIRRYAAERLDRAGSGGLERLSTRALPLEETDPPPRIGPSWPSTSPPIGARVGLLLGEDDLDLDVPVRPVAVAALPAAPRSPLATGAAAAAFTAGAIADALARAQQRWALERGPLLTGEADGALSWARREGLDAVFASYAPVGPGADARARVRSALEQAGIAVHEVVRPFDREVWPHASRGFFRLKKRIPELLDRNEAQ